VITRIGFLQFVDSHHDPLGSLERTLDQHADVSGSLIVLPEGFNRGKSYAISGKPEFHIDVVLDKLTKISKNRAAVLVAGLIGPALDSDPTASTPWPGLNSAYWIDRFGGCVMCHKASDDTSDNYTCSPGSSEGLNPVKHGDCAVGALICMDVRRPEVVDPLMKKFEAGGGIRKIICVPAAMSNPDWLSGRSAYLGDIQWRGRYIIVANSNPLGCPSFVANANGRKTPPRDGGNRIALWTWDELEQLDDVAQQ